MHRTQTRLIRFVLLSALLLSACQPAQRFSQNFLQFGTLIEVTLLATDSQQALDAFGAIETLLKKRHSDWHGWLAGDLSSFNQALARQPGEPVPIPVSLRRLIKDSRHYFELSGGRFNPALGKLIGAWGFHQQAAPDDALIAKIRQSIPRMDQLETRDNLAISHNPHLQLDFGAIAKGLAIEEIAGLLRQRGIRNFIINAGGDVFSRGSKDGAAWTVAIENPFAGGVIAGLELNGDLAIFTSGSYRRFYQDEGKPLRHHIIDPLTGEPSRFISSATVLHHDPVRADAAATALMLTAPGELAPVAANLGIDEFMLITNQATAICSKPFCARLKWQQNHGLNIQQLPAVEPTPVSE